MKRIDNINDLLGNDIKQSVPPGARLKIAASCFSIYAYGALNVEQILKPMSPSTEAQCI